MLGWEKSQCYWVGEGIRNFFFSLLLVLGLGLSITSFWEAWDTHSSSPGSHVGPAVVVGGGVRT